MGVKNNKRNDMDVFGKDNGDLVGMAQNLIKDNGGLEGLKAKLDGAGLGDAIGSWIGTGDNQAVDGQQLAGALGQDQVQGLADKTGLDLSKMLPMLAAMLPLLIDKLTPDGDEAGADDRLADQGGLQDMLGGLLKGGLGGLFK